MTKVVFDFSACFSLMQCNDAKITPLPRKVFTVTAAALPESCVFSSSVCYFTNVCRKWKMEKEQHNILGQSIARAQKRNQPVLGQSKRVFFRNHPPSRSGCSYFQTYYPFAFWPPNFFFKSIFRPEPMVVPSWLTYHRIGKILNFNLSQ